MFERKYRLLAKTSFGRAKGLDSPTFRLKILENNLLYNRLGFIVSKKVDKRAVVRNRTKRRFRSCLENMSAKIKTGNDMIFLIKKEAVSKKTSEQCSLIKTMLKKEGFLE